eukprot:Gb_18462 [translate_table: standard]
MNNFITFPAIVLRVRGLALELAQSYGHFVMINNVFQLQQQNRKMHFYIEHANENSCGIRGTVVTWNSMITKYAQNGRVEDARQLFDKMPERNVVSWNSMIAGYVQNGRVEDARQVFDSMPERDVVSWNGMIAGYVQNGRMNEGRQLFDKMPVRNVVSWTTMISGCAQNGRTEDARQLFDKMPEPNIWSWNAMIAGYAQNDRSEEALKFFRLMLREGMTPNPFTFPSVLRASASVEALELGRQVHACVLKIGFDSDVFVGSALVTMYARCGIIDDASQVINKMPKTDLASWNAMVAGYVQNGRIPDARQVFDKLSQRNVVSWTAMIAGYAQNGFYEEALIFFIQMLRTGTKANQSTFTCVLRACASLAALEQGRQVHSHINKTSFESDVFVKNALITMYAKCGSIEDANQVFRIMPERDVISWNAMISGYAQHGHAKEALQLFEQSRQAGIKPDEITFVGVLCACSHGGLVDEGWRYFDSMIQDHYLTPMHEHYACMVDLLGRAGHLDEAEEFINKMPLEPDVVVWGALLSACKTHVNIKLGKRAAEHLFELEPNNDSTYVMLSNIYAAASRWDDAIKVRKMMKNSGVKKKPGCSWIEVKSRVHAFVTGDRSHPQTEKIYAKLERLTEQIEAAGYVADTNLVLHDVPEEEKEHILCHHSEKLAIAFGLLNTTPGKPIRIMKNLRVCFDCHTATKFISKIVGEEIVVRDANRFHHFKDGFCSCRGYW